MKALPKFILWIKRAVTEPTCCEQLNFNCRQGRDCPLRQG